MLINCNYFEVTLRVESSYFRYIIVNYQRDRSAIPKGNLNYSRNNGLTQPAHYFRLLLFISFMYLDEEWSTIKNKETLVTMPSTESVFGTSLPEFQHRFMFSWPSSIVYFVCWLYPCLESFLLSSYQNPVFCQIFAEFHLCYFSEIYVFCFLLPHSIRLYLSPLSYVLAFTLEKV